MYLLLNNGNGFLLGFDAIKNNKTWRYILTVIHSWEAKLTDFLLQNIVDRDLIKTATCRQSLVKEMIYQDRSMTMKIQVQMINLTLVQKPVSTSQTTLVSLTSIITLHRMYGLALSLYYIHDFPGICVTKQCDLCEFHYL